MEQHTPHTLVLKTDPDKANAVPTAEALAHLLDCNECQLICGRPDKPTRPWAEFALFAAAMHIVEEV